MAVRKYRHWLRGFSAPIATRPGRLTEGKLTAEAFLKASEWRQVWGYDAALYMPLFQFARLNRIPMIALNVERKLVSQVGQQWMGVGPSIGARRSLRPCSSQSGLSA